MAVIHIGSTVRGFGWRNEREVLLHELGHVYDYSVMADPYRNRFRALIHDKRPWRAEGGDSPHEQFGEAYAACALSTQPDRLGYGYGYHPRPATFKAVCALIRAAYNARPRGAYGT
jgi:hypothetical protein